MNPMRIIGEATHTVTSWLDKALYAVRRPTGSVITLPKATGSGFSYKFIVGETVTSNTLVIQVADSVDVMAGKANTFETAATTDTITLNGTTTGGYVGDEVELTDIGEGLWAVNATLKQTGTAATPFSAAV